MPADRCFIQRFTDKDVKSVADLLSPNNSWIGADALASLVGVRSSRIVAHMLCSVLWTYTQLAPAWEQDQQSNEQNAHRIPSLSTFPELVLFLLPALFLVPLLTSASMAFPNKKTFIWVV